MALLAPRKNDQDLFAETTMSFGEHLEELRVCLWKAMVGLVLGFMIGLLVGNSVVGMIQKPLTDALIKYYSKLSLEKFEEAKAEIDPKLLGMMPQKAEDLKARIDQGMSFEMRYVDAADLGRALGIEPPKVAPVPTATATGTAAAPLPGTPVPAASGAEAAEPDAAKMAGLVPMLVWQQQKDDDRVQSKSMNVQEPFMIWIKASFIVGALISAPWVFYQIWMFVASGLYKHERKYIYTFLPFSLGLFFLGAATAYLFVFEPVLDFLFDFNKWLGIHPDPRINEWMGFVLMLPLGFGVSFQLPLVMLFLERINVFSSKIYIEKWRIAVMAIFILAAVLTPADPYSMLLMAVPLTFLYFGGILLTIYLPKGPAAKVISAT